MMQSLLVVPRLFPMIESGEKRSTIRWRETEITPGLMTYICQDESGRRVVVEVTRVMRMPLSEAAAFLGRDDEWPKDVMLEGMREHYPGIEWTDEVAVIEHLSPAETLARPHAPSQG